jgi:3-oxoisoapionate decarboxylase
MRLGVSSYTYVWSVGVPGYPRPTRPLTAQDLLRKAAELQVRVLQLADNLPLDTLADEEIGSLDRRARELGVALEVGTSGIERERLLSWLRLARRLGSPILRVVLDTRGYEPTPVEAVRGLAGVMPEFENAGVTLAIENHDRFESRTLLDVIRQVGSKRVGICFDTANSIGCLESADRVLDILGPHVVNVHLKDYCISRAPHNKGFTVEGRPAGGGQLDVPKLIDRLRGLNSDANVIVELWPPLQNTLEESVALEEAWAAESVACLRRFIPD